MALNTPDLSLGFSEEGRIIIKVVDAPAGKYVWAKTDASSSSNYIPGESHTTGDVVLSAIPAGSANGGAGVIARYEWVAGAGVAGGGGVAAMDLTEEESGKWEYKGAASDTYAGLSDTDMTAIQDGDVARWMGSAWAPIQLHAPRTPVATVADIFTYEADHPTERPLVVGDRIWVEDGGEKEAGGFREVLQSPVTSPIHLSGYFGDILLTGFQWSGQAAWSSAPQWVSA